MDAVMAASMSPRGDVQADAPVPGPAAREEAPLLDSPMLLERPAATRRRFTVASGLGLLFVAVVAYSAGWRRRDDADLLGGRLRDVTGLYIEDIGKTAGFVRSLELDKMCLNLPARGSWIAKKIRMSLLDVNECNLDDETTDQRFQFLKTGQLVNVLSGLCVSVKEAPSFVSYFSDKDYAVMEKCDSTNELQIWSMEEDQESGGKLMKNKHSGKCMVAGESGMFSFLTDNDVNVMPCTSESMLFGLIGKDGRRDGVTWEWISAPLDTAKLGFMSNQLTGKCINNLVGKLFMWDCAYDGSDSSQWWKQLSTGQLQNFIEGTCLARSGSDLSMEECSSSENQKWNWHQEGAVYATDGRCLDVDGVPAQCAGHFLETSTCDLNSIDTDMKWMFLTLDNIPKPPYGSPDRPMPDVIETDVSGIKGTLVKAGAECKSDDTDLGSQKTLEECMLAAHRNGWKYFSYGKAGMKKENCYQENTKSEICPEGFEEDDYNFYKIDPIPPKRARPFKMEMGELATKIYNKLDVGQVVADWTVKFQCDKKEPDVFGGGHDYMAIWTQGDKCAWTFAGTDDLMDGITDIKAMGSDKICGMEFHSGFIGDLMAFMKKDCYTEQFAPFFASDACKGGRYSIGHSLGGAIAEAFAYCANYQGGNTSDGLKSIAPAAPAFTIDGLYTFGAPGIAREPLRNGVSADGCFPGLRFFNIDANAMDPVPWVCRPVNFVHPWMDAVWMYEDHSGYVRMKELPCGTDESAQEPISDVRCLPKVGDHSMYKYLYRCEKLLDNSSTVGFPADPLPPEI